MLDCKLQYFIEKSCSQQCRCKRQGEADVVIRLSFSPVALLKLPLAAADDNQHVIHLESDDLHLEFLVLFHPVSPPVEAIPRFGHFTGAV